MCISAAIYAVHRLEKREVGRITDKGFVPTGTVDYNFLSAAMSFTHHDCSKQYIYKEPSGYGSGPAYFFRHTTDSEEPDIYSFSIESGRHFDHAAAVYKINGSHRLFNLLKKWLIRTGDLGVKGKHMVELNEFNHNYFERYGLFAMGEPGFDTADPYFVKVAWALREPKKNIFVGLGFSGRHIVGWGYKTTDVIELLEKLRVVPVV